MLQWLAVAASTLVVLFLLVRPSQRARRPQSPLSLQILVVGDIGRSPRMQYHALSLAKHGCSVQLIGYSESDPVPELVQYSNVIIVSLAQFPSYLQTEHKLLFLLLGPLKVAFQVGSLFATLAYATRPADWLVVQNPPSIPTLLVASVVCWLRGSRLAIDWHNLGYSLLALKLGPTHPFVTISRLYERSLAHGAHLNVTVTNALSRLLHDDFGISAGVVTLHDRPASQFRPLTLQQEQAFLLRHPITKPYFDQLSQGLRRLVVSSTSWTIDEDFSILLHALCDYSAAAVSTHPQLPELLVIITGKGPRKDPYLQLIDRYKKEDRLEMVDIKTAWLSFDDYASLLSSADLGVSLHTSSSGVDLPMKVVDMFGAGLPVVGYNDFEAWSELVKEGINGKGFTDEKELSSLLINLFDPSDNTLDCLRQGAVLESNIRWENTWNKVLAPEFGLGSM